MDENKKRIGRGADSRSTASSARVYGDAQATAGGNRPGHRHRFAGCWTSRSASVAACPRPRGRDLRPESSGKTTLTLEVIAQCQKAGGQAAFIDAGTRAGPDHAAEKLG